MANEIINIADGKTYYPCSQERYAEMAKALELNRHARYIAVEEFRAWCAANKGVDTVQAGLQACTVDELVAAAQREAKVSGWTPIMSMIELAARHLRERAKQASAELAAAKQSPISLEEETQDAD